MGSFGADFLSGAVNSKSRWNSPDSSDSNSITLFGATPGIRNWNLPAVLNRRLPARVDVTHLRSSRAKVATEIAAVVILTWRDVSRKSRDYSIA